MMRKHWNYKLPLVQVVIVGLSIGAISALFLTLISYGTAYYKSEAKEEYTLIMFLNYLWGYVKWYLIFSVCSIPIVYSVLIWQLRKK
jgi:H+/Cl- antiporter ClcA